MTKKVSHTPVRAHDQPVTSDVHRGPAPAEKTGLLCFERRFDDLVSSMQLGKPPRGSGGSSGGSGHGGGRKPRHLH